MESKSELNAIAEAQRKELDTFQGSLDAQWVNSRLKDGRMGRCLDMMQKEAEMEKDFQEADRQIQNNIVKLLRDQDSHGKVAVDNMTEESSKIEHNDEYKGVGADYRKKVQDKMGSLDAQVRENEMERREEGRVYSEDLREQIRGNTKRRAAGVAQNDALAQNVDDWDREWGSGDHDEREKTFHEHSSPGHLHGLKKDDPNSPVEAVDAEYTRVDSIKHEKERVYSKELRQQIAGNTKRRAADLADDNALTPNLDDWDREWGSGDHNEREKVFKEHSASQFYGHEAMAAEDERVEMVKKDKERVFRGELLQQIADNANRRVADHAAEDAQRQNNNSDRAWSEYRKHSTVVVKQHPPLPSGYPQVDVKKGNLLSGKKLTPNKKELTKLISSNTPSVLFPKCNAQCRILKKF